MPFVAQAYGSGGVTNSEYGIFALSARAFDLATAVAVKHGASTSKRLETHPPIKPRKPYFTEPSNPTPNDLKPYISTYHTA